MEHHRPEPLTNRLLLFSILTGIHKIYDPNGTKRIPIPLQNIHKQRTIMPESSGWILQSVSINRKNYLLQAFASYRFGKALDTVGGVSVWQCHKNFHIKAVALFCFFVSQFWCFVWMALFFSSTFPRST